MDVRNHKAQYSQHFTHSIFFSFPFSSYYHCGIDSRDVSQKSDFFRSVDLETSTLYPQWDVVFHVDLIIWVSPDENE